MKKIGYTLAEVVIVMLIIAAVVGITIGLTKKKLDNVISYLYYSSYSIAQEAVNKMIENFKDDDEEYIMTPGDEPTDEDDCDMELGCLKAPSGYDFGYVKQVGDDRIKYGIKMTETPAHHIADMTDPQMCENRWHQGDAHPDFDYLTDCQDITDAGQGWYKAFYGNEASENPNITNLPKLDGKYIEKNLYNSGSTKVMIYINSGQCSFRKSTKFDRWKSCSITYENREDYTYNLDKVFIPFVKKVKSLYRPNPITIPRMGKNFCQKFVSYVNTSQTNAEECIGDLVDSNDETGYYADKKPDIILRNGMKIYNMSQDPVEFDEVLSGNSNGKEYITGEDDTVNIDEWGYLIYIDIDGSSGSSTLWQDVYPFYITMSGKVIPAYNEDTLEGGADKKYLMFGVFQEIGGGSADRLWIAKSAPFKDAACKSGYLKDATPYCSTVPAVTKKETCNTDDCKIEVITPLKFFK